MPRRAYLSHGFVRIQLVSTIFELYVDVSFTRTDGKKMLAYASVTRPS